MLFERLHIGDVARPLLSDGPAHRLERFERLLADFHLLTDYAWRRGPDDPITYSGSQHCVNPFANFEAAWRARKRHSEVQQDAVSIDRSLT
ncbi:hypothetical protein [Sinorhizobium alkalisoli]|uniref:Uncharacterized protein n=1 Tax=Sinorhizobium alkalisoli TaxID=1752398 RepID=A0A1E3V5E3_9HYPH|nr:hypothetical protein [Sinorhizobium alkalisoli]MCG5480881.1 hypothetical protein [Sinorhizobium alkalisoli]ODR88844.1 hypothetical protein A8M32_23930 [Sinorhizobium alkalisoli]QFI70821.1 hypothetical protein EKH55_5947 [Sinorhizobium alkalisoli]